MKRLIVGAMICAALVGCTKDPESVSNKGQGFKIEVLFTDDDNCTMKRFSDGSQNHYYAVCDSVEGRVASTSSTQSCGKNCTRTEEIQTIKTN